MDYAADGTPIGIEITTPSTLELSRLNRLLEALGQEPIERRDVAPLFAA